MHSPFKAMEICSVQNTGCIQINYRPPTKLRKGNITRDASDLTAHAHPPPPPGPPDVGLGNPPPDMGHGTPQPWPCRCIYLTAMYLFQCKRVKMEVSTLYKTITLWEFITCIPSKCSLYQNPPHPYLKIKSVVENDSVFVWKWRQRDSPFDLLWFEYRPYTQVCIETVWIRYLSETCFMSLKLSIIFL